MRVYSMELAQAARCSDAATPSDAPMMHPHCGQVNAYAAQLFAEYVTAAMEAGRNRVRIMTRR